MTKFRVTSKHLEDLADGRTVVPGDEVSRVDEKDAHNKRLIERGALTKIESVRSTKKEEDDS